MSKAPLASAQLIPCQNPNPMSEPRLSSVHAALACGPPARKHTLTVSIKEARGHGRHVKRGIILGVAALVLGLLGFWACWASMSWPAFSERSQRCSFFLFLFIVVVLVILAGTINKKLPRDRLTVQP